MFFFLTLTCVPLQVASHARSISSTKRLTNKRRANIPDTTLENDHRNKFTITLQLSQEAKLPPPPQISNICTTLASSSHSPSSNLLHNHLLLLA